MELAMGAMGPLFPKLIQLLEDEYVAQKGLKSEVESLSMEMKMVHAALEAVSQVPLEQLSEPDKVWAARIRELSYDMEDAIDAFMVRVAQRKAAPADAGLLTKIAHKASSSIKNLSIKKIKERHRISYQIKDIKNLSKELSELRARYAFSGNVPPVNTGIDPRVINLHKNKGALVGIEESKDQVIGMLTDAQEDQSLKIISVVGSGGLGKTTLAQVVHDQLNTARSFQCSAFVSVGRNPNIIYVLREMLEKLIDSKDRSDMSNWKAERCCEELGKYLQGKRYNIVVDDVWDEKTWDSISCALPDSNCGSIVIVTTRNSEVSTKASDVYKLKPLSAEKSRELFNKRTSDMNGDNELVDKIVEKCNGVPLAIIAISSLLVDRVLEDWEKVYDSLIVGHGDNTRTILLYSYYDLPSHLRPCLLYLSMYPEESAIQKSPLIWRWITEGFVQPHKEGDIGLYTIGERYFNELMNRSMIDPIEVTPGDICGCRVHDIVLDLIRDLSAEENFTTVLNENKFASSKKNSSRKDDLKVRRLSIHGIRLDTVGMPLQVVRSLYSINSFTDRPLLPSFQACRVLAVDDISSTVRLDLKHVGQLLNLRYLEVRGASGYTKIELPKEIGNLKFLQTLITSSNQLPPTVCELTQLMCLHAPYVENFPVDWIGNLVRLEQLSLQVTDVKDAEVFVVELGKLIRLRVLEILFTLDTSMNETFYVTLVQSLNNLQQMRDLCLSYSGKEGTVNVSAWKSWKPPPQLSHLYSNMYLLSSQLMSPCRRLRWLRLYEMGGVDMGILALLPELVYLELLDPPYYRHNDGCIIVGANGFKNLRVCKVKREFKFLPGAMPRLESLGFMVRPAESDLAIGLRNLVSLKEVQLTIDCFGCSEVDISKPWDVLARDHPNHPTFEIDRIFAYKMLRQHDIQPDKVLGVQPIYIPAREWVQTGQDAAGLEYRLRHFPYLEEITLDIDCVGSTLSEVEQIEENWRLAAARHPRRPKVVMKRINEDKMMMGDALE